MKHSIIFIGLVVHKESIDIALADDGRNGEVRSFGAIAGDMDSLDKAIRKFRRSGSELRFVYEAGPWGYEICRHLTAQGLHCDVIAPSRLSAKLFGYHFGFLMTPIKKNIPTIIYLQNIKNSFKSV